MVVKQQNIKSLSTYTGTDIQNNKVVPISGIRNIIKNQLKKLRVQMTPKLCVVKQNKKYLTCYVLPPQYN